MRIHIIGQLTGPGVHLPEVAGLAAVGVELDVRQVRAMAVERGHHLEHRVGVAGQAEVEPVDVDRVRQGHLVDRRRQPCEDRAGRDLEPGDDVVERADVPLPLLPGLDPAGIDHLHAERLRRIQGPGQVGPEPRAVAVADPIHHIMIVPHEDQERLVDDRRVGQLVVGLEGHQGRDRGIDGRRVAEPGIFRPGAERARHAPESARPADQVAMEAPSPPRLLRPHRASPVDFRPRDVAMDVDPGRHHDVAPRVDRPIGLHR